MSITLYPYKLLMSEMEARVPGGLSLLPGQLLRFEGTTPTYARVTGVKAVRKKNRNAKEGEPKSRVAGCIVRLQLLCGQPDLSPQTVTILNDAQMAAEVQRLQQPAAQPFALSPDLIVDASRLGPLTLIEGDDFVLKYETLMSFVSGIQPYQKVLIVDPLGLFEENTGVHYCQAGRDVRLSIQTVGHQRFLDAFGELFPGGLRNWALQAIAASWPITQDFIGLERLLDWRQVSESPLKSLILQNQQAVLRAGIFAERPNQVMHWTSLIWQPCNVADLSTLPAPWKALFYEETVRLLFQEADTSILPVLIYPEHYLGHWPDWLKHAEESGLNLVVLTSSQHSAALEKMVSTRVIAESRQDVRLEGRLTSDLPITFALGQSAESSAITKAKATVEKERLEVSGPIVDLAQPQTEARTQFEPAPQEHQQILDQLFANQISIAQAIGQQPVDRPNVKQTNVAQPTFDQTPVHQQETDQPKFDQQFVAQAPELDYPDADEGAWTEAATAYTPPQPKATPVPPPDVSFPDSWTMDDFDFDLNLDQKPLDLSQIEARQLEVSGVLGSSHTDFSDADSLYSGPEPLSWQDESIQNGPLDLSYDTENLLGDEVPVYHKAAEPTLSEGPSYQAGDRVRHDKYGVGVVTKVVPMNDSVVLNITFESVGKRLMDPQLAELSKEPA